MECNSNFNLTALACPPCSLDRAFLSRPHGLETVSGARKTITGSVTLACGRYLEDVFFDTIIQFYVVDLFRRQNYSSYLSLHSLSIHILTSKNPNVIKHCYPQIPCPITPMATARRHSWLSMYSSSGRAISEATINYSLFMLVRPTEHARARHA